MATSQRRQFQEIGYNVSCGSASLTPAAVTTGSFNAASTIPVPNCQIGDFVHLSVTQNGLGYVGGNNGTNDVGLAIGNVLMQGEVTTGGPLGVVTVKFINNSGATVTPPAGVYTAVCITPTPDVYR